MFSYPIVRLVFVKLTSLLVQFDLVSFTLFRSQLLARQGTGKGEWTKVGHEMDFERPKIGCEVKIWSQLGHNLVMNWS